MDPVDPAVKVIDANTPIAPREKSADELLHAFMVKLAYDHSANPSYPQAKAFVEMYESENTAKK